MLPGPVSVLPWHETWRSRWSQASPGGSRPCLMTRPLWLYFIKPKVSPPWPRPGCKWLFWSVVVRLVLITADICRCPAYADTGLVFACCVYFVKERNDFFHGNMFWSSKSEQVRLCKEIASFIAYQTSPKLIRNIFKIFKLFKIFWPAMRSHSCHVSVYVNWESSNWK